MCDSVCADLFSSLVKRDSAIADVILFNPPYVPTSSMEFNEAASSISAAWAGGILGREVIIQTFN